MRLRPEETDLLGKWEVVGGNVIADTTSQRIRVLTTRYLEKVAGGGWETLYRDPDDGRYWELTYPHGEMHGGGPPRLTYLSHEQAKAKYGNAINLHSSP
jgi:Immunity protein 27